MGITLERAGLQVVEVLGVQRPRSCWSRWFSCSCEALGVISLRGIQQVATILTCPRFDAPWADQTGSTSSPHMRIMRYGSCPLKPAESVRPGHVLLVALPLFFVLLLLLLTLRISPALLCSFALLLSFISPLGTAAAEGLAGYEPCEDACYSSKYSEHDLNMS